MESMASNSSYDAQRVERAREGFNEFFDWHMREYIEYV